MQRSAEVPECAIDEAGQPTTTQASDVRLSAAQGCQLARQALRPVPVIVIPLHDELTPGHVACEVAFRPNAVALCQPVVMHAGLPGYLMLDRLRAVVDDDELS